MYSNYNDLVKIKRKSSTNPDLKKRIAETVIELKPKIDEIKLLPKSDQREAFNELRKPYTQARQFAYRNGATSEGSPTWAVPAVCENWIFGYQFGSQDEIQKIESVIEELSNPLRPEEGTGGFIFGTIIIFIGTPLVGYYLNWWVAIIVAIIGLVISGWKYRYNGPFNIK